MATYNGEKYIQAQLDSILNQSYNNIAIYISDDASTDRTFEILKQYQEQSPHKIFLTQNDINIGFLKNFEKLLQKVDLPYIALSDQDDIWEQNKLELLMEVLEENEVEGSTLLIYSDLKMISKEKVLERSFFQFRKLSYPESNSFSRLMSHSGVMGNTILMNKKVIDLALPFPDALKYHDYWLPLISKIYGETIVCNKALVNYRIHENNISNSTQTLIKKRQQYMPLSNHHKDKVLEYLLDKHPLDGQKRKVLKAFLSYLQNSEGWYQQIYYIVKYNIVRSNLQYRAQLFMKIFLRHYFKMYR